MTLLNFDYDVGGLITGLTVNTVNTFIHLFLNVYGVYSYIIPIHVYIWTLIAS